MTKSIRTALLLSVLGLAACATTPAPVPPTPIPVPIPLPPQSQQPALPSVPPAIDKSTLRLSIASVGDMMIGTDYPADHLPDDDGLSFLADVSAIISAADIGFGNLEGVLIDGGQPAKKCGNPAACYLFRSPTRYADRFKAAGFDILSLANNHARDFDEAGRSSSMQALSERGMFHSGREGDFASFEANGLKVAFLAYAVTKNSNMMLDYELAFETVAECAASHDIVVVSFHGGAEGADASHIPFAEEEYYGEPRGDVVWFARGVVDAGADLVIGHGPHVVRGMERYKNRMIAYSLGNFATYYGISVTGKKGVAPILTVTLDGNGAFVDGMITSTLQRRPAGPSIDDSHRALRLIRELSAADFGQTGFRFQANGEIHATVRGKVKAHELVATPD